MKLSIIIVSYNVEELLKKCLSSVKTSTAGIENEIFVVDNDSYDNSASMVKKNFPNVKLIENRSNAGFSKANNQAIKVAKGEYVLILNPDTELLKDTLLKMINYMDTSGPDIAVSTCRVELADGSLDRDCRRSFPTPSRAFFHFSGLSKIFRGSKIFDTYNMGYVSDSDETELDACVGAFMLIRRNVLKEVGPFDEDYFFYGEDLDLCYRIREKGYKIMYSPITKIIHHKGASSGIKKHSSQISKATRESKVRAIKESTRAMRLFYDKHYKKKYSGLVTSAVFLAIETVKYVRLLKIRTL